MSRTRVIVLGRPLWWEFPILSGVALLVFGPIVGFCWAVVLVLQVVWLLVRAAVWLVATTAIWLIARYGAAHRTEGEPADQGAERRRPQAYWSNRR